MCYFNLHCDILLIKIEAFLNFTVSHMQWPTRLFHHVTTCNDQHYMPAMMHASLCFYSGKVEVNNQDVQTELLETRDQHVQAGEMLKKQGGYTLLL